MKFAWIVFNDIEYYEILGSSRRHIDGLCGLKVSYKLKDDSRGWFNHGESMNVRWDFYLLRLILFNKDKENW